MTTLRQPEAEPQRDAESYYRITDHFSPPPSSHNAKKLTKARVREILDGLPDEFTFGDLVTNVLVVADIDKGILSAETEPPVPHEEVMAMMERHIVASRG